MEAYDEIYAISDIHLGGRKDQRGNFQIFRYGKRLGNFIRDIAGRRPEDRLALVLNGDVFDSLAEDDVDGYVASTEQQALRFMQRLYNDVSFAPVWQGLEAFVSQGRRDLVFVIGNHDIEVGLPVVQDFLLGKLAGQDPERRSRIRFAATGGGFACTVGGSRVFCTHGNEVDSFNWVDYNLLGQLANAMNAGRNIEIDQWMPNAGTRLVVDVMNIVKQRYPFIDILKPETSAVAAVLMAMDRETFSKLDLRDGIPVLKGKRRGRKVVANLLGDDLDGAGDQAELMAERYFDEIAGPELKSALAGTEEDELLRRALAGDGHDGQASGTPGGEVETLGIVKIVAGRLGFIDKTEALRTSLLDWLQQEVEFDSDHRDKTYKAIVERVGSEVDFVVTGHTHLARALQMPGGGYYFNSGTWIRTLRLTREALDKSVFEEQLWKPLQRAKLDDLDSLRIPGPDGTRQALLEDRTHAVRISAQAGTVTGELLRVTDDASGGVLIQRESGTTAGVV